MHYTDGWKNPDEFWSFGDIMENEDERTDAMNNRELLNAVVKLLTAQFEIGCDANNLLRTIQHRMDLIDYNIWELNAYWTEKNGPFEQKRRPEY